MHSIQNLRHKTFTFNLGGITKFTIFAIIAGIVLGTYLQYVMTPKIVEAYNRFNESMSTTIEYKATEEATDDRLEIYYEEEYTKLQSKYDQAQEDEARLNAIDRVETEFETMKEEIRERELFL